MSEPLRISIDAKDTEDLKIMVAALQMITQEYFDACEKYPSWPVDPIHATALVSEEAGEALQAANNYVWNQGGTLNDIIVEHIQTGAMALRALIENLKASDAGDPS